MKELFQKEVIEICKDFSKTFKKWKEEPTIFEVNKVTDLYLYKKNGWNVGILVNTLTNRWVYVFKQVR